MAFKQQELFRKYEHIEGYRGEKTLMTIYLYFCGTLLYYYILKPIVIVKINADDDFTCSSGLKKLFLFMNVWQESGFPLSQQLIFFTIMWQLSRIQSESVKKRETET